MNVLDSLRLEGIDINTLSYLCPRIALTMEEVNGLKDRMLKLGGCELTVTFRPELQECTPCHLTEIVRELLWKRLRRETTPARCILIGEYSPLGLYHMHGMMYASPRTCNILRRVMAREIGRCEWKMVKFLESYVDYCFKPPKSIGEEYKNPLPYGEQEKGDYKKFHDSRVLYSDEIINLHKN